MRSPRITLAACAAGALAAAAIGAPGTPGSPGSPGTPGSLDASSGSAVPAPAGIADGLTADVHRPIDLVGARRANAFEHEGRITRLYGKALATGASARESAESFLDANIDVLGARRADLAPVGPFADGRHVQPIMYQAAIDAYKFTGVYYRQERDGVPVFRGRMMLLARNEPGFPIVLASLDLRDVGDFQVLRHAAPAGNPARDAARRAVPNLEIFTEPETVVFAGVDDAPAEPVLATVIIGESLDINDPTYGKWLFVVDARTGGILYREDQVHQVDVEGSVSGRATQGFGSDRCGPEEPEGMPYARVNIGGNVAYADESGDFVIPNGGNQNVTVESRAWGRYFRVFNQGGSDALLQLNVSPPGPADFMHNDANNDDFPRAEVNAYNQSNVVRDFTLAQNPDYPTIANQTEFTVNVNVSGSCNAFYNGGSINFYRAGGSCPNMAYSTIVHHEYGHHIVATGGSGQGAYGEGMSDVMGVLITDDPGLAYGFFGNCNTPLRNADNNVQYPCDGPIHSCGRLLSGSVWDTRNELRATNPGTYREILSSLAVNAVLLHGGSSITPAITVDYLTLDDNDGDLSNGTPHYCEIAAGFGAHNMDAPPAGCSGDIDGDEDVDFDDVLLILAAWGDCNNCDEDLDGDDDVDFQDLLLALSAWGDCSCE